MQCNSCTSRLNQTEIGRDRPPGEEEKKTPSPSHRNAGNCKSLNLQSSPFRAPHSGPVSTSRPAAAGRRFRTVMEPDKDRQQVARGCFTLQAIVALLSWGRRAPMPMSWQPATGCAVLFQHVLHEDGRKFFIRILSLEFPMLMRCMLPCNSITYTEREYRVHTVFMVPVTLSLCFQQTETQLLP